MGQIVWIASYPKSGSTWVRAFLNNYLRDARAPVDINGQWDVSTGENSAVRFRRHDPRPASAYSIADVQRMRPLVHRDIAAAQPGTVFVKTHNASLLVEGMPLITPEVTAGAVYIVRDPRDVAISFSHHFGLSVDATIAVMADLEAALGGNDANVYERTSAWSAHVHFWTRHPNPRLHVMRYEAMAADPAGAFGALLAYLGEPADADRLERAIRFSAFDELRAQERAGGFVERPADATAPFFRKGQPGEWRTVLTPEQRARIERDHGGSCGGLATWNWALCNARGAV